MLITPSYTVGMSVDMRHKLEHISRMNRKVFFRDLDKKIWNSWIAFTKVFLNFKNITYSNFQKLKLKLLTMEPQVLKISNAILQHMLLHVFKIVCWNIEKTYVSLKIMKIIDGKISLMISCRINPHETFFKYSIWTLFSRQHMLLPCFSIEFWFSLIQVPVKFQKKTRTSSKPKSWK
jgi:hypothetical protein